MNQREMTAWNYALDQHPALRPYQAHLRRLAIKDAPGYIDPKQLTDEESGIPWTMVLGWMISNEKTGIPKECAFEVPLFIIEYEKQYNKGVDYSHAFDSVKGIVLLKKETDLPPESYKQAQYFFAIEDKPILIQLDDYQDHLYLYLRAIMDIPDALDDKEYHRRYLKYSKAWAKAAETKYREGSRLSEFWEQVWCRTDIPKSIQRCSQVANVIQKFTADVSRRVDCLRYCNKLEHLVPLFPENKNAA